MKKVLATVAILLASTSAFAGSGGGSVACATSDGEYTALYTVFHSQADSYSEATVFVKNQDGSVAAYEGSNEKANTSVVVKVKNGTLLVAPTKESCIIKKAK